MRMKNNSVIEAWKNGQDPATNHRRSLYVLADRHRTNSLWLYSYNEIIGVNINGTCFVKDLTAKTGHFHSVTTSGHVNKAKSVANIVMHPKVWKATPELYGQELPF